MPERSRANAWLREELILALALYRAEGYAPSADSLSELSQQLRSIPIEIELAADPTFRSVGSVARRLLNYAYLDPNATGGLAHGGAGVGEIWTEFGNDPVRLAAAAEAIRANLQSEVAADPIVDDEMAEAEEGRILTRIHISRERNRRLAQTKKQQALTANGSLSCEACGFDFSIYGERGVGFIECHHRLPVSELRPGQRTRLPDLALVCANCHRMIHRRRPWLTVEQVQALFGAA